MRSGLLSKMFCTTGLWYHQYSPIKSWHHSLAATSANHNNWKLNGWFSIWSTHHWLMTWTLKNNFKGEIYINFNSKNNCLWFRDLVWKAFNKHPTKYTASKGKVVWFSVLCLRPLPQVFRLHSHNCKWDAVNDFVPGSHYAGSRDMHSLSHENY